MPEHTRRCPCPNQAAEFLTLAAVNNHPRIADQKPCLQPPAAPLHDASALRHDDEIAPAPLLYDGDEELELVTAVTFRVNRV